MQCQSTVHPLLQFILEPSKDSEDTSFSKKTKIEKKAISIKTTKMWKSRTHFMYNGPSRKFFMLLYFFQTSEETLKVCEMMTSHYFLRNVSS